jgi:hypothetical protein
MNRSFSLGRPALVLVLACLVALALSASEPALAASSGDCVTAHIDAPFRLPDGLLYPAGTLTLCDGGKYSPVDTFQKILVEGSSIGLFISKRRRAESRGDGAPQVQFHRDTDGNLALVGLTLPSVRGSVAFRLKVPDETLFPRYRHQDDAVIAAPAAAPVAAVIATTGSR